MSWGPACLTSCSTHRSLPKTTSTWQREVPLGRQQFLLQLSEAVKRANRLGAQDRQLEFLAQLPDAVCMTTLSAISPLPPSPGSP